jgi:hypothetical protein
MYETPKLSEVGMAEEVILGAGPLPGADLDGFYQVPEFEFAEDE